MATLAAVDQWFTKANAQFQQKYAQATKRLATRLQEQEREEEAAYQSRLDSELASPLAAGPGEDCRKRSGEEEAHRIAQVDAEERARIDELRAAAKATWSTLETEHDRRLEAIHTEQARRLASEQEWSRAASAAGPVLDRGLFEKLVERCGKGRDSAYARDKMARFWQAFDQDVRAVAGSAAASSAQDEIINMLKGL